MPRARGRKKDSKKHPAVQAEPDVEPAVQADDAPRWSSVFRWWVQAPPGGWPVMTGFLDAYLEPGDRPVEELMQVSDEVFDAVLASLER